MDNFELSIESVLEMEKNRSAQLRHVIIIINPFSTWAYFKVLWMTILVWKWRHAIILLIYVQSNTNHPAL